MRRSKALADNFYAMKKIIRPIVNALAFVAIAVAATFETIFRGKAVLRDIDNKAPRARSHAH
jgi:hypothetical protein